MTVRRMPGRLPGAVAAGFGVLAGFPAVFLPVLVVEVTPPGPPGEPTGPFRQGLWSWGRYDGVVSDTGDLVNEAAGPAALATLVAALVLGVVGITCWVALPAEPGRVLGVGATAVFAGVKLSSTAGWLGEWTAGWLGTPSPWVSIRLQPAGWAEMLCCAALVVAVLLMTGPRGSRLCHSGRTGGRTTGRRAGSAARGHGVVAGKRVVGVSAGATRMPRGLGGVSVVRGRLPAAVTALVGVLLAVPTIFWPVMVFAFPSFGETDEGEPFQNGQAIWSWGKFAPLVSDGLQLDSGPANLLHLALLVALLVVGLAGAAAWAFVPGSNGRVVGAAATAVTLGTVLTMSVDRLGAVLSGLYGTEQGVSTTVTSTGWLEIASGAVLLAALLLMLWRPLLAVARLGWARARAASGAPSGGARAVLIEDPDAVDPPGDADRARTEADAAGPRPSVGTAVLQDGPAAPRGRRERHRPGGPSVGFSDDAESHDRRFRPPPR